MQVLVSSNRRSCILIGMLLLSAVVANAFLPQVSTSLRFHRPPTNFTRVSKHKTNATADKGIRGAPRPKRFLRRWAPMSTAAIIGWFSVLEILESSRELMFKWHIHHWRGAHGITLLAMIRLVRSVAILQIEAAELGESVEELSHERRKNKVSSEHGECASGGFLRSVRLPISRFITSPVTAIIACIMAAVASIAEIIDDLRPGAHHGTALLALSEMYYQTQRFRKITGRKRLLPFKSHLGIPIALAAAAFAAFELYEDIQPGAHHGLAILAVAELVENINRSKLLY
jgi:hypothetical protein